MKRITLFILAILFVAAAAFAFFQTERANQAAHEIAQLRTETSQRDEQLKKDAAQIASLEEKTEILNAESAALRAKLQSAASSESSTVAASATDSQANEAQPASDDQSSGKPLGGFFAKMFKDPEMKKTLVAQQSLAMRQFYTDFVKSAGLTPQQTDAFFNLLADRQMKMMDKAGDMMKGGSADATAAAQRMADDSKAFNEQLKSVLGDARATQFQNYEKTLGDRIVMQQFSQQLSATSTPLSADQNTGLMQVIADERTHMPAAPFQPGSTKGLDMSDDQMRQFFQSQEDLNARVRARAVSILNPAQMQAFEAFQKQQLDLQKMGISMAKQMFGTKPDGQ